MLFRCPTSESPGGLSPVIEQAMQQGLHILSNIWEDYVEVSVNINAEVG